MVHCSRMFAIVGLSNNLEPQALPCDLKFADDLWGNQIQPGPAVHQHLCDLEVADCWGDQQWKTSYHSGTARMILHVKDGGRTGPFERLPGLWRWFHGIDFSCPLLELVVRGVQRCTPINAQGASGLL